MIRESEKYWLIRESERKQILELLQSLKISSDSVLKMVDELASLLDMFRSFKKAGRSAALTMSTKGGTATKVKLEVELDDAEPSPISTSTPSTSPASAPSLPACQAAGDRLRPRGSSARRAKAKARAARHQAFLALPFHWRKCSAPATPPPRRPLQIHPSPTDENRRRILTVDRKAGYQPTFSQLDGEEDLPPDCPTCQGQRDSIAPENRIPGSKNCSPPHNPATCTPIKPCSNCDECFHRIRCKDWFDVKMWSWLSVFFNTPCSLLDIMS